MKKETSPKKSDVNMPLVNPNAAGIDIGDTIHAVAVPVDRDKGSCQIFRCYDMRPRRNYYLVTLL